MPLVGFAELDPAVDFDQCVMMDGWTWSDYERLLAIRGEKSVPKITYLEGTVELMTPSRRHDWISATLDRLILVYAEERGIELTALRRWTVRRRRRQRGLEPDECYVVGADEREQKGRPDLAVEVVRTSGGLDKLAVYAGLEVPEVWFWRRGRIEIFVLRADHYEVSPTSEVLLGLDVRGLERALAHTSQTAAVHAFRRRLRGE